MTGCESSKSFDVVIVGGGLGGSVLAHSLCRADLKVGVIEQRPIYPPCLKAERFHADHARLLEKSGLAQAFYEATNRIDEVRSVYRGTVYEKVAVEIYGGAYHEIVNSIRKTLSKSVGLVIGKAISILEAQDSCQVVTADGRSINADLVVISNGSTCSLSKSLGITRVPLRIKNSLVVGFDIEPQGRANFDFDALNFHSHRPEWEAGIMNIFKTPTAMRVNLISYWEAKDRRLDFLREDPRQVLEQIFPGMQSIVGPYRIASQLHACPVEIYRVNKTPTKGIVLLGDAYQCACPASGTGITKLLTDVNILAELIPKWLLDKQSRENYLSEYYNHPRKISCDAESIQFSEYLYRRGTAKSLRWRIERNPATRRLKNKIKGLCSVLRRARSEQKIYEQANLSL